MNTKEMIVWHLAAARTATGLNSLYCVTTKNFKRRKADLHYNYHIKRA